MKASRRQVSRRSFLAAAAGSAASVPMLSPAAAVTVAKGTRNRQKFDDIRDHLDHII
jgi:TctA family transporter